MKHIDNLKSQLLRHAVYFLENMEEFSPFGLTLFEGDRIVLDGVIEEDLVNDSSSETIIKRITDKLINRIHHIATDS
jgi:hypothetical protein